MSKCDSSKNFLYVMNNYDKIIYVNGQSAGRCLNEKQTYPQRLSRKRVHPSGWK